MARGVNGQGSKIGHKGVGSSNTRHERWGKGKERLARLYFV